jgi:anti-sigma factor RsiW
VTPDLDCERVRLDLMAAFDGEGADAAAHHQAHVAACPNCQRWLQDLAAMNSRFKATTYAGGEADLWPVIESRLRSSSKTSPEPTLYVIGALCLGWRLLQLFTDLPLPLVQWIPLLAIAVVLRRLGFSPLAIQTSAPELQKRGA